MADAWQTYPFEFRGGLITNLAPTQQGVQAPGSARILRNFEPSIFGGYRRVEGFTKFDTALLPNSGAIRGLIRYKSRVYAVRGNDLFRSGGSDNLTAKVNGAVSSSATITVDDKTSVIATNMQVAGTGITGIVTVDSISAQDNTAKTATVVLSTAVTLADNTDLTFSAPWTQISDNSTYGSAGVTIGGSGKVRFLKYDFDGTEKLMLVDGTGKPYRFDDSTFAQLSSLPSDTSGASFITNFKNHIVLGNGKKIVFSAPYEDDDFTVANGGGIINVADEITGLIVFREQLIVFCKTSIFVLNGNSVADFTLQPVSRDLGCVAPDTIQEIGGDIIFLGPDGLRLFSATDRIGDFSLGAVSKTIQSEMLDLINSGSSGFTSTVIREKSQYRVFAFLLSGATEGAKGIAATQLQEGVVFNDLRGINAHVAHSEYEGFDELIYFANNDGYVYQMESGNTFDGKNILASFATPFVPLNDPSVRKTIYKGTAYLKINGGFELRQTLQFDYAQAGSNQSSETLDSSASATVSYGSATYGASSSVYGTAPDAIFNVQTRGSGFVVSVLYETLGNSTDAVFTIDSATLQYITNARR